MRKTIVFLVGAYYPNMGASSSCIDKFIQALKEKYDTNIICRKTSLSNTIFNDSKINLFYINNWYNSLRITCESKLIKKKHLLYSCLLYILRLWGVFMANITFPTYNSWMTKKYIKVLKLINRTKNIDIVISVNNPVCAHLAALEFRSQHSCKWITYCTDPWTYDPVMYRHKILKKRRQIKNYTYENLVYEKADYNIFTDFLYEIIAKNFPQRVNKAIIFPFTLSNLTKYFKPQINTKETILVYAGSLRADIRNPRIMLSICSKLIDTKLHLYQSGDCDKIINLYKSNNIIVHPLVNKDAYLDLICNQCDILINIGNSSAIQFPSKMLELISTGKPIINFYYNKDTHYNLIERYPLGINIKNDSQESIANINSFCKNMKGKQLSYQKVKSIYPEYAFEPQLEILDTLIQ